MSEKAQRVSLSEVVRALLEKGGSEHHSVTLTRNAKGQTQIEVVVRASEGSAISMPSEAAATASAIYDALRKDYPYEDGGGA